MADPRFFTRAAPLTLGDIAALSGAVLSDQNAANRQVMDVATLSDATPEHLSFLDNRKYVSQFKLTKAGACFVRPDMVEHAPENTLCLITKNPYRSYALTAQAFYPAPVSETFVAPTAVIDATASIGPDCYIDHGAVIGAHAVIGARCRIGPHAVIEKGVVIGDDTNIGANVYLTHALIGSRVVIYPGAVIGRPGFGFAMDSAGFVSVPQLGRVIIQDMVEIGANTTIDRGAGPDTVIGYGTRIDNLVQIGHNVQTGKYCVLVGQSGVSGSSKLGDFVVVAGQSGIAGHLSVGAGAKIAGQSGVMRDVDPGAEMMGTPAVPIKQFMRQIAMLSKISSRKKE